MHWTAQARVGAELGEILEASLADAGADLPGGRADLAFVFLGAGHAAEAPGVLERVREALGGCHVLGCGAGGVIGGGREYEHVPALSFLAGQLPGAAVHGFHVTEVHLPDADAPPRAWHELVGVAPADAPAFVLLVDPFTMPAERLLEGLDFAYAGAVKVGGLASGGRRPGEQVLLHGDRVVREGAVGLALMGDVELVPAVAQGCRAMGPAMRITGCEGQLLHTLDGRAVMEALGEALERAPPRDRALARQALFLGFEMDPFEPEDEGPWLIRNLLGVDPETRGVFVGESLRRGRRVRFHVRDRATSSEDLERTLERAGAGREGAPEGALLFSCLGRGRHLYGTPDHDSQVFRSRFADTPLGGFFCSGEIGPVGGVTHVHGYTSAFGLIRRRTTGAG